MPPELPGGNNPETHTQYPSAQRPAFPTMRRNPPSGRPTPGRPTREAAQDLAQRIVDAAQREFLAKGFDGASIEGIAALADTSKLTIYRHFKNKKQLFATVIEGMVTRYANQLTARIDTSLPTRQVLLEMGGFLAATYFTPEAQSLLRMLISELPRDDDLPPVAARIADMARQPVERYLRFLQSKEEAVIDDTRRAAIQFVNLCMLGQYFLLCKPEKAIPGPAARTGIVRSAVELFIAGYRLESGPIRTRRRTSRK